MAGPMVFVETQMQKVHDLDGYEYRSALYVDRSVYVGTCFLAAIEIVQTEYSAKAFRVFADASIAHAEANAWEAWDIERHVVPLAPLLKNPARVNEPKRRAKGRDRKAHQDSPSHR